MTRPGRLEGRNCLIVGGTSGIGLATARRFLDEGARVVICGRSEVEREPAHAALAARAPDRVWSVTADATDPEGVEPLFATVAARLVERLDILFHVAGLSGRRLGDGALHECSADGWDAVMAANARSVFLTNQAAVQRMLSQSLDDHGLRGTILNMGSVLADSPAPAFFGTIAYAASKGAIAALTRCAAARYARDRIRFNLIAPGLIDTPMARRARDDPSIRAYLATKQPLAGGPGSDADCAEAALYLCEPASRFVTGIELRVDGGWSVSEGQIPGEPT